MALRMFITKDKFQLLHISLVREYLDLEFAPSKDELKCDKNVLAFKEYR